MVDIKGVELRTLHSLFCISQIKLSCTISKPKFIIFQISFALFLKDIGGVDKNCMNIDDRICFDSIFKNSVLFSDSF